jgi:hypothetical protein
LATVNNSGGGTGIIATGNAYGISPDSIGGTLAALGDRYTKFFFSRLVFEFVPYQPNSTDGHGFAFGFNPEGIAEFAVSFSSVSTLEHSMVLPMTGFLGGPDMNCLEVRPSRKSNPWFWNEDDTATSAGQRQTFQGILYGVSDTAITNATTWGTIWCHYVVEFCDITPDQGFTLRSMRRMCRDGKSGDLVRVLRECGILSAEGLLVTHHEGEEDEEHTPSVSPPQAVAQQTKGKGWSII